MLSLRLLFLPKEQQTGEKKSFKRQKNCLKAGNKETEKESLRSERKHEIYCSSPATRKIRDIKNELQIYWVCGGYGVVFGLWDCWAECWS